MNLKQAILHSLSRVYPHLMPEEALRVDVSIMMTEAVTLCELGSELREMESKKWVVAVRDEVTEMLKWKITNEGRALNLF